MAARRQSTALAPTSHIARDRLRAGRSAQQRGRLFTRSCLDAVVFTFTPPFIFALQGYLAPLLDAGLATALIVLHARVEGCQREWNLLLTIVRHMAERSKREALATPPVGRKGTLPASDLTHGASIRVAEYSDYFPVMIRLPDLCEDSMSSNRDAGHLPIHTYPRGHTVAWAWSDPSFGAVGKQRFMEGNTICLSTVGTKDVGWPRTQIETVPHSSLTSRGVHVEGEPATNR